jgi:hypothetical protein
LRGVLLSARSCFFTTEPTLDLFENTTTPLHCMARALRIHWRAPTFTVLFLISGIIFSIGHHLFYRSLAGTPASNEGYNIYTTVVSKQQLNIAAGTAFAFVVKATLVAAITATYIQLFWREIAHRTKSIPLESIDSIFSALANGFTLFRLWIWYRYPLLFSIAVVCWQVSPFSTKRFV